MITNQTDAYCALDWHNEGSPLFVNMVGQM